MKKELNLSVQNFPVKFRKNITFLNLLFRLKSKKSYPSFEELDCYTDLDTDWDEYDEAVEAMGLKEECCDRHKLLGYANIIQGEMLTECERIDRGLYCGDSESYQNTPEDVKKDIAAHAKDWMLLFQLTTISDGETEILWGDCGSLHFYISREDLAKRNFSNIQFSLQCG